MDGPLSINTHTHGCALKDYYTGAIPGFQVKFEIQDMRSYLTKQDPEEITRTCFELLHRCYTSISSEILGSGHALLLNQVRSGSNQYLQL